MDFGQNKSAYTFIVFRLLGYMLAPRSLDERQEIISTWLADGMARLAASDDPVKQAIAEQLALFKQRSNIKRDPEAMRAADVLAAKMAKYWQQSSARTQAEVQKTQFEPAGGFAAVSRAPGTDRVAEAMLKGIERAVCAGAVWIVIRQILEHHADIRSDGASVNKALFIIARGGRWAGQRRDETTVRKIWSEYRTVAHLWAGFLLLASDAAAGGHDSRLSMADDLISGLFDPSGVFVSLAYDFQRFALAFRAQPGQQVVVTEDDLWLLPPMQEVPGSPPLSLPPLEPDALQLLKEYRAPSPLLPGRWEVPPEGRSIRP
jgi:hypothetical protein